jgi:hypothetical protein
MNPIDVTNSNGDRLYEYMQDHVLSDGPITFPMMGWPCYVQNLKKNVSMIY